MIPPTDAMLILAYSDIIKTAIFVILCFRTHGLCTILGLGRSGFRFSIFQESKGQFKEELYYSKSIDNLRS